MTREAEAGGQLEPSPGHLWCSVAAALLLVHHMNERTPWFPNILMGEDFPPLILQRIKELEERIEGQKRQIKELEEKVTCMWVSGSVLLLEQSRLARSGAQGRVSPGLSFPGYSSGNWASNLGSLECWWSCRLKDSSTFTKRLV